MPAKALLRLDPSAKAALESLQSEGEDDIYRHLVEVFLETSEEFLKTLKSADVSSSQLTAHSWRSSSMGIGAQILAELCGQIEVNRDLGRLQDLVARAEDEYQAVKRELHRR